MADILPPAPIDAPFTSYNWADWYKKVRDAINNSAIIAWASITGTPTSLSGYGITDAAKLNGGNTFTGAQIVTPTALTDATNIATDASVSNHFTVTLGGNRTLDNPSNLVNGVILNWKIKQDGTGSRTLAYGNKFKWAGGTAPVLTTTANAVDYLSAHYFSNDGFLVCSMIKDIK